jgi:hypothetical protein
VEGKKYIRGVFDKETRRKPLAFAATIIAGGRYSQWAFSLTT